MAAQTCLRCGAPIEPDDTVCYACGAPIGDTKTPTQPVNVPRTAERAAVSPSATASHPVASAAQEAAPHGPTPSQPLATRPVAAVAPAHPDAARQATPSNRWVLLLLGAVLLAALAVGAGLVVRAVLAGPPVARTTLYRDTRFGYSFQRPALWSTTAQPDGVLLTDSDGASTVRISVSTPNDNQSAAAAVGAIASATPGLTAAPAAQFAGQTWEQVSGQVTGADGAVHQVVVYATLHDSQLYLVTCSSPLASFDATNNLVFQPLLSSFTFH